MPFKHYWKSSLKKTLVASVLIISVAGTLSGCGLFGSKKDTSKVLASGKDLGCLDTLNTKVDGYSKGTITNTEWSTTFDCIVDQVAFFKSYVRGNAAEGSYNQGDIASLIRDFLIKKHSVSGQFISSLFDFKAALFGGGIAAITPAELDKFTDFIRFLEKESLALLPYIRTHEKNPTTDTSLNLADAVALAGDHSALYLEKHIGTHSINKDSFIPFAKELLSLAGSPVDSVDEYEEFIRSIKVLIFGGDKNLIEAWTWPKLARELTSFYGLYKAYLRVDGKSTGSDVADFKFLSSSDKDEYLLTLMRRARKSLNRILTMNGGAIGLDRINPVIDGLPNRFIESQKKLALKADLPNILNHFLGTKAPRAIDTHALSSLLNLAESGFLGQIWAKRIFQNLRPESTAAEFEREALSQIDRPSITTEDRNTINNLIDLSNAYVGLFPRDGSRMIFTYNFRSVRTENHMILMQWFNKAMHHVFVSYATGPNGVAQQKDLTSLSNDFGNTLKAFGKFSPDVSYEEVSAKRFREGNLFMPNSNGDLFLDEKEGTYYLAFLFASGSTTASTWEWITKDWKLCIPNLVDEIGKPALELGCFRDAFFKNIDRIWSGAPYLRNAYQSMSMNERNEFIKNLEVATRKSGYTNLPIGEFDIDSISALPYYVESLMLRFDTDRNGYVDRDELIDHAFPIFREALKAIPKVPKGDLFLQSALTYVVVYGRVPTTSQFLGWHAKRLLLGRRAWKNVFADRAALYRVLAVLAETLK